MNVEPEAAQVDAAGEAAEPIDLGLEALEQSVLPSPGVTTLRPDARDRYHERVTDADSMVSERYQVNSRLRQADLDTLPSSRHEKALREWFVKSGRTFSDADLVTGESPALRPFSSWPQPLGPFLSRVASLASDGGLLFVADLHLVADGWIWLVPPGQEAVVAERRFSNAAGERLVEAVPSEHRKLMRDAHALLTVTTVPWRLQVLHGERGYRRALLESGISISGVASLAASAGLGPSPIVDFADVAVDDVLFNDGVERFCTLLLPLSGPSPKNGQPG